MELSQAAIDFYKKLGVIVEEVTTLPPPPPTGGVNQMVIQIDELIWQSAGEQPNFFFIDLTLGTVLPNAIDIGKQAKVIVEVRDANNQQLFIKESTFTVPQLNASREQQFTASISKDNFNIKGTVFIQNLQGIAIAKTKTFEAQIGITPKTKSCECCKGTKFHKMSTVGINETCPTCQPFCADSPEPIKSFQFVDKIVMGALILGAVLPLGGKKK